MMNTATAINAYRQNTVQTASKTRVVVMLTDRARSDTAQAVKAIERRDPADAHLLLRHAQDIISELAHALDVEQMPGGYELADLYEYIEHLLTEANLTKTVTPAQQALTLIGELADIFHQAEEASR